MNVIEIINNERDELKRKNIIQKRINFLETKSLQYQILDTNIIYNGFISKTSKIQFSDYGYAFDIGLIDGYEMNQQDYFFEFLDYICENGITDFKSVINSISPFLREYFGVKENNSNNREVIFDNLQKQLLDIYIKDNQNFENYKTKWLNISMFKNNSMAECTEYAALTQNILAFLGLNTYYVTGHLITSTKSEYHAFNLVETPNGKCYLIDSANSVGLYDENLNLIATNTRCFRVSKEQFDNATRGNSLYFKIRTCNYKRINNFDYAIDINNWIYEIEERKKSLS